MKKFLKIIALVVLGALLIQFIPVDKMEHPIQHAEKFEIIEKTPVKIATLMRNACFDCHSYETKYPDYASVAPLSWVIKSHVSDAREEINFSIWGTYNADLKKSMLKNAISVIEDKSMPKQSYILYHPKANITTAERALMAHYFQKVLDSGSVAFK